MNYEHPQKPLSISRNHSRKFSFLNAECAWHVYDADDASLSTCTELSDSFYDLNYCISEEPSHSVREFSFQQSKRQSRKRRSTAAGAASFNAQALLNFAGVRAATFARNMDFCHRKAELACEAIGEIGIVAAKPVEQSEDGQEEKSPGNVEAEPFWQARMRTYTKNLDIISSVFRS